MPFCERLLVHATTIDAEGKLLENQAVAIAQGGIAWCGMRADLPVELLQAYQVDDSQRQLLTPGLIDCHTHLVYAGNRADEFKLRLEAVSYAEIARAGGGILSTLPKVLAAVTSQAAKALGLEREIGAIKVGLVADLVLRSVYDSASLCYHFGYPLQHRTMVAGEWLNFKEFQ